MKFYEFEDYNNIKVGDLIQSLRSHRSIALVLALLGDGWHIEFQWIDTLEIDNGSATLFEVISEGR